MKKYHPLVSIVIPVYNGSNYMEEAINSALNQTYDNIEIIVVNDGSDDNGKTDKIAKSYGNKIRYFSKANGGVASALNLAIDKMKGQYFSWLSHDDVYHQEKLEHQIEILNTLDDKHTVLYSSFEIIDENSNIICIVDPSSVLTIEQLNTPLIPLFRGVIHGCSMLISKKWFEKVGKFDETLKTTQDYKLWFDILNVSKIHFCKTPLIKSRSHPDQGSKTIKSVSEELNDLWIRLLDAVSEEKMKQMEGSCYAFFRRAELFLESSSYDPYEKAVEYAKHKAKQYYGTSLVSIILPVYNRIDLSIKALESALNQTYDNIEIIVINDGSTEDVTRLQKLSMNNPKVKYFEQENKGASAARNLGIQKAKGDYIAFLDADDMFAPEKIDLQLKKMIDDDCYISHTAYNRVDKNGEIIQFMDTSYLCGDVFNTIISECTIATPTVLLRKSLLDNNKFIEDIRIGEDNCLWIDLLYERKLSSLNTALTDVLFDADSTLNNTELYLTGLVNITHHIVHTIPYERYKEHLKPLLILATNLLPQEQSVPLLIRVYKHFMRFGLKETVKKIFYKLFSN